MKSMILTSVILNFFIFQICLADVCELPQKYTFLSYKSLSKRDTLPNMFEQISKALPKYSTSFENSTQYNLTNIYSQLIYNEHQQTQQPNNESTVKVELGVLKWLINFNYNIHNGDVTSTGTGVAEAYFDHGEYFIKQLTNNEGQIQWNPVETQDLRCTNILQITYSNPKLPLNDKITIQKILSDNTNSTQKIKQQMLSDLNSRYKLSLKDHLNKEYLFPDKSFSYSFQTTSKKNITFDFQCAHKNFTLETNTSKGIEIPFYFGLQNDKTDCQPIQYKFNQNDFGGVQEALSLKVIESIFKSALKQGLYDITLGKQWQIQSWQFYMGDLANLVSQANKYPADDQIEVKCEWDRQQNTVFVFGFSDHEIYTEADEKCTILYKKEQKISFTTKLSIIVRISPEKQYLNFQVTRAFKNKIVFKAIDPKFQIVNDSLANFVIKGVLDTIEGSRVLGSGWKTISRRFPSSYITNQYLLIFDPSQKN